MTALEQLDGTMESLGLKAVQARLTNLPARIPRFCRWR